ncbi:hypothetical protein BTO04_00615 [Polaribacter sp. SA4-10]|uniref:hypothetical protein n=1 Tax=Polaribacter sp. SA4-10 TaxID=754397 RepID=UPI000B3CFBEE|nr:hypothetical protein [Polaribacter sp. SA4-10]ARV05283.1 hypothetical protein BTO04_00615 [Polaribacter sp. SA4-10]
MTKENSFTALPQIKLNDFLNGQGKITHSAGEKESYAFFEMLFCPIDSKENIEVLVTLEENIATEYRKNEKGKLKLEYIVEPSSIGNFQKELHSFVVNEDGKAQLIGLK